MVIPFSSPFIAHLCWYKPGKHRLWLWFDFAELCLCVRKGQDGKEILVTIPNPSLLGEHKASLQSAEIRKEKGSPKHHPSGEEEKTALWEWAGRSCGARSQTQGRGDTPEWGLGLILPLHGRGYKIISTGASPAVALVHLEIFTLCQKGSQWEQGIPGWVKWRLNHTVI